LIQAESQLSQGMLRRYHSQLIAAAASADYPCWSYVMLALAIRILPLEREIRQAA
jgi:hypothetical protein